MSNICPCQSQEVSGSQSAPAYSRIEILKYSELETYEQFNAKKYRIIAHICTAVGLAALILFTSVVGAASGGTPIITAAIGVGAFFIGMLIYNNLVRNGVFAHFKNKERQALQNAQKYHGYTIAIDKVKEREPELNEKQQHILGLRDYWTNCAEAAREKINEINTHPDPTPKELDTRHRLSEGRFLCARVYAAYFQHLYDNPDEDKKMDELISFCPISRSEEEKRKLQIQNNLVHGQSIPKEPSYVKLKFASKISFKRREIGKMSIDCLSKEIFGRQKRIREHTLLAETL